MKHVGTSVAVLAIVGSVLGEDRFNYRATIDNDYGPEDWNKVSCNEVGECPGWPDGWELGIGWALTTNKCEWCPEGGHNCGLHRQSPIDLLRADSTTGHDSECYDYHWMAYEDRTCRWSDIIDNDFTPERNQFRIRRHSLQILQPVDESGELQCRRNDGRNAFPRLDYSKGFPNWWHLSHTEITVPSEHHQEGKQYDAEVHLAHFYEIDHERKMGKVAIFLEADSNVNRWPFLDKLICQWREVEENVREACDLASVPPYPGCRNPSRQSSGGDAAPTSANPPTGPSPMPPPSTGRSDGVVCSDYFGHPVINLDRICKDDGCCTDPRSATDHCHEVYAFFGDNIDEVCSDCCSPSKTVGPPPPLHPVYPPIDCTAVENPFRMCKPNSCCDTGASSSYCQGVVDAYVDDMPSICWYCCSEPKAFGPAAPISVPSTPAPVTASPVELPPATPAPVTASPLDTFLTTAAPVEQPVTLTPVDTPTLSPNPAPTEGGNGVICSDYFGHPVINLDRICKDDGCCTDPRSATDHCHEVYAFFGDNIDEVCSDCCSPSKTVGPPPPLHPAYPPIDCTAVENPFRMCKPNSCCDTGASSSYCEGVVNTYGGNMPSICWYCCSEPKAFGPAAPISVSTNPAPVTASPAEPPLATQAPATASPAEPPLATQAPATASPVEPPLATSAPAEQPVTPAPINAPSLPLPAASLTCSDYDDNDMININRICKDDGCCTNPRSATDHCHFVYDFFGDDMATICSDCCQPSKDLAPPPPPHPTYPPIQCSLVDNPYRICKPGSCCESTASTSSHCQDVYQTYGDSMGSVCWYCCSEPKEVDTQILSNFRRLDQTDHAASDLGLSDRIANDGIRYDIFLPQDMYASDLKMDSSNFEVNKHLEADYLNGIDEYRNLREDEEALVAGHGRRLNGNNYEDIRYSPYQWMREVKTEYYFRYEGGQMVPPCFETVHYRVMKDPIRIHPTQLAELERLLAWRISPPGSGSFECESDTAGRPRAGSDGNAVDLNRPLQAYSNIHRKVFCECDDWDSKFEEDIDWCQMNENRRWYDEPYNFDSDGNF